MIPYDDLTSSINELTAERDRLKEVNALLVEALEYMASYIGEDRDNPLLDKARAALAAAKEGK
jgi:hypothetical protein